MPAHPDPLPVIHIGMPKTATKTLQWRIFARHSGIFYLGRFDGEPFQGQYQQYGACRDQTVFRIMDEIAYRNFRHPDIATCKQLLSAYLAEHNAQGRVPVWSWESYSTDSRRSRQYRADNLKNLLGSARILMTIRQPLSLLESAYLQQLKRDNIGAGYRRGKPLFCTEINDWIRRDEHEDISNHLDYAETVRMYSRHFGRENVCVMAYESLLADANGFFDQLSQFLGVDPEETRELVRAKDDNARWSEAQLQRLREIRDSLPLSLRFRYGTRKARKRMLGLNGRGIPRKPGARARAPIEGELGAGILRRVQEDNAWLDEEFQLGLDRYGYYPQ
ncbi:hypothetical protein F0M18_16200 [Pseudohalioglobus sediminis]|uniref:Sulfotransferase domain-containing protein n=1 Tax=Pseudohalioglobus sediminis TaxID=2606449 RepID=A0A5B0WSD2_9GAMM|nr:sulfotransferase [Pseudohalioglobus sediminis]KAA1189215.1 hypothetical protein F0M18_16200 [Pseudohalioglobus sediminis]